GVRLAEPVRELLLERQRLLAGRERFLVVAEQGVAPADGVEGVRLSGLVADRPVPVEGLPGVVERALGVSTLLPGVRQAVVRVCGSVSSAVNASSALRVCAGRSVTTPGRRGTSVIGAATGSSGSWAA